MYSQTSPHSTSLSATVTPPLVATTACGVALGAPAARATCHVPFASARAAALCGDTDGVTSTTISLPGGARPQMLTADPACRTMWSPNVFANRSRVLGTARPDSKGRSKSNSLITDMGGSLVHTMAYHRRQISCPSLAFARGEELPARQRWKSVCSFEPPLAVGLRHCCPSLLLE